jgi:hypothetical protein
LILMLVFNVQPLLVASFFVLRFFTQFLVHKKILDRLGDGQLLIFSLLWELLHILFLQTLILTGTFRKQVKWK